MTTICHNIQDYDIPSGLLFCRNCTVMTESKKVIN